MINGIGVKFLNIINNMYNCSLSAIKIQNKISSFFNLERGVKQGDSLSLPCSIILQMICMIFLIVHVPLLFKKIKSG